MTRPKNSESTETEARMQQAIEAMSKDSKYPLRKAARDFNVPRSTLQRRVNGGKARNKAQEDHMNLTHHEELELANWIITLIIHGYAPRYCTV
jgi:hypothetical protein